MMERKDRTALSTKRIRRLCTAVSAVVASGVWCAAPVRAQNESDDSGEKVFMQNNCFVCHGQQGFGGVGPAFRNDPFLKLNDHVVGQILIGRGVMPPFGGRLDDGQVAAVATYIRNNWGNNFGPIQPEQVAQIRRDLDTLRRQPAQSQPLTGNAPQP
jgi:mono/diheme cytochrome c family protein